MLASLKYFFKKYKFIILFSILINIPLILIGTIRTNYKITSKGDTLLFESVVDIDTDYKEMGSFSTIYVTSIERSTPFMNLIARLDDEMELKEIEKIDDTLSDSESYFAGKIMYASSISQAIISSYSLASNENSNIKLSYSFDGYYVTYKNSNSDLKIGDNIISIKRYDSNLNDYIEYDKDTEAYKDLINNPKKDDIWVIEESNKLNDDYKLNKTGIKKEIKLKAGDSISTYPIYNIDLENTIPHITYHSNMIGGPSGGLLQALSIYNRLTEFDYTKGLKIAGTGTINKDTLAIGEIGGIEQKIITAIDDDIDIFFCPKANYLKAKEKYDSLNENNMKLIMVETLLDAINYLKEDNK